MDKRPTQNDEAVIRAAAEEAIPELREWLDGESDCYEDAELIEHLTDAVNWGCDGYERAKVLERRYSYTPDFVLVEFLEGIDLWAAERAAVAEWVKQNDLKPPLPVGTKVILEGLIGEITKHDERLGQATVFIESRGHVRSGVGTHGLLIAWEKLIAVDATQREASDVTTGDSGLGTRSDVQSGQNL